MGTDKSRLVWAWVAGVLLGSQVCRQPAEVAPGLSVAPAEQTGVRRIAGAVAELGDAVIGLVLEESFYPPS